MNCSTGAKYCSSPMVVIGSRRADAPKNSSGTAVMMPEASRSQKCPAPSVPSVAAPLTPRTIIVAAASGASTIVSTVRLVMASALGPTRFFTKPYRPKLTASVSAIQGSLPYEIVSTPTATKPIPTAAHWSGRSVLLQHEHAEQHGDERVDEVAQGGLHGLAGGHAVGVGQPVHRDQDGRDGQGAEDGPVRGTPPRWRRQERVTVISSVQNSSDHTTRLATISTAPAGCSAKKYRGSSPQSP